MKECRGDTDFRKYCTGPVFPRGGRRARLSLAVLRLASDLCEWGCVEAAELPQVSAVIYDRGLAALSLFCHLSSV